MKVPRLVYLAGEAEGFKWNWKKFFRNYLPSYFCYDPEEARAGLPPGVQWDDTHQRKEDALREQAEYEIFVVTPEDYDFFVLADAVRSAYIKKDRCLFLLIESINGPGIQTAMVDQTARACRRVATYIMEAGGRSFDSPHDLLNYLNQMAERTNITTT